MYMHVEYNMFHTVGAIYHFLPQASDANAKMSIFSMQSGRYSDKNQVRLSRIFNSIVYNNAVYMVIFILSF